MKKRGAILIENGIFIVLNVIFISILVLFLWKQGSGAVLLEQTYAKQISLMIDSAQPGMEIKLNMQRAKNLAEDNKIDFSEVVRITENIVIVKLSQKGGYEYSFFNDVKATAFPDEEDGEYNGNYIFTIAKNE